MTHSKEWLDGYNAALDAMRNITESNVKVCKDIEDRAKAEKNTIKADFIGMQKDAYEGIIRIIAELKEVYQ